MCHRAVRENLTLLQGAYGRRYFRGQTDSLFMAQTSRMAVLYRTNSFKVLDKAKVHFTFHGMAVKMALTAATTPALRLPESVRLKSCPTFLKSYKGSSAHPAESWQDGRGGLFRSMKCGCCSLPYFSRNSEIRPSSLGHHEKKISSLHQIGKRENTN